MLKLDQRPPKMIDKIILSWLLFWYKLACLLISWVGQTMLLVLVLICCLFARGFGQTVTNTVFATKNLVDKTMIFNIRINGVNLGSGQRRCDDS